MSFIKGFEKTAGWMDTAKLVAKETGAAVKHFGKGLKSTGAHTLGDTLSLKGTTNVPEGFKDGIGKAFTTPAGRRRLANSLGKATPSLVAGGAYMYGGKKLYDKTLGSSTPNYSEYYQQ